MLLLQLLTMKEITLQPFLDLEQCVVVASLGTSTRLTTNPDSKLLIRSITRVTMSQVWSELCQYENHSKRNKAKTDFCSYILCFL